MMPRLLFTSCSTRLPFLSRFLSIFRRNHAMNIGSELSVQKGKTRGRAKRPTDLCLWKRLADESTFCFGDWISFVFFPSATVLWTFDRDDGIYVVRFYSVLVWFLSSRWTTEFIIRIFSTIKFVWGRNAFLRSIFFISFFYCASLWIILDRVLPQMCLD